MLLFFCKGLFSHQKSVKTLFRLYDILTNFILFFLETAFLCLNLTAILTNLPFFTKGLDIE